MANQVPESLAHLVYLNLEFGVLLCLENSCCVAISPKGIVVHMQRYHYIEPKLRKELQEYIDQNFSELYYYNSTSIRLPANGSTPQPILPIIDGFQCKLCTNFLSTNRRLLKVHGNKAHNLKRVVDEELFDHVRIQSWFRAKRERYWCYDSSRFL